jgi:hypothetical protein
MAVAISNLKLRAVGERPNVDLAKMLLKVQMPQRPLSENGRSIQGPGGFAETPCYDADQLRPGNVVAAPDHRGFKNNRGCSQRFRTHGRCLWEFSHKEVN